jgi:hypothetical protein
VKALRLEAHKVFDGTDHCTTELTAAAKHHAQLHQPLQGYLSFSTDSCSFCLLRTLLRLLHPLL